MVANMAKAIFFLKLFLGFFLVQLVSSASGEETVASNLEEINRQLVEENKRLQQAIQKLQQHRDIESDIEEIKKILEGYGEDLTALRIQQGYLLEAVSKHDIDLLNINSQLAIHSEKLSGHDVSIGQHEASINENHAGLEGHTQTLNDHAGRIQSNTDSINSNTAVIQEHQNSIAVNSQNIQSVTDNYNNYRNSQVKFYAETLCCEGYDKWPDNTRIWYKTKWLDTHNALSDSQFFAPITGLYAFTFTADFTIFDERPEWAYLNLNINENLVRGYLFDSHHDDEIFQAFSISFTLLLNQGDRLDLSTSGDPSFDISRNPATLMGYLLHQTA